MVLLLAICTLIILVYFYQRHLIYLPNKTHIETSQFDATQMKVVKLQTEDHLEIFGWYLPSKPGFPTLLFFHGNMSHIGTRVKGLKPYMEQGYGIFLLEYRGYANNPGAPTEQGLYQDARSAIAYLHQERIPYRDIILYGESLGTGIAVQIATEYPIGGLILQSPYTSMTDIGQYHYPYLPVRWLLKDRFDSIKKIKNVKAPVLIIYYQEDSVVPSKFSEALYQAANSPKYKVVVSESGINHNTLITSATYQSILDFLDRIKSKN